ncbi:MAG: hypothetical protein WB791_01350 [Waddliaceae bacterium]
MRLISVNTFSRAEASQLLPFQPPHRLLFQIIQIQLIDKPSNMNAKLRIIIIRNDPVRYRNNLHLMKRKLIHQRQHLMIAS